MIAEPGQSPYRPRPRPISLETLAIGRVVDTNAEVFGKAQSWLSTYDVHVVDLSWNYLVGETQPLVLGVYFGIDEEEEPEPGPDTATPSADSDDEDGDEQGGCSVN